jgi:hypothetical protein
MEQRLDRKENRYRNSSASQQKSRDWLLMMTKHLPVILDLTRNEYKIEIRGLDPTFLQWKSMKTSNVDFTMFQVWPHSETFPNSFPYFYWILNENRKKTNQGAGIKWFFEIILSPIGVMLKKWGKIFFLQNRKSLRFNILVEDVPSNHMVKGPCPRKMALRRLLFQ